MKFSSVILSSMLGIAISTTTLAAECESKNVNAELCQKANSGDAEALYQVAKSLLDGSNNVKQDVISAVDFLDKAISRGSAEAKAISAEAFNKAGNTYYFGENGVAQNTKLAIQWYKKAARAGHPNAAFNIGCMYAFGEKVAANKAEAKKWLQMAVDAGNKDAQSVLNSL